MINVNSLNNLVNNKSHANRGMDLENLINETNEYYLAKDIALIYKKPTPIGISKVGYRNGKKILEKGYFKEKSTLDYNGLYNGYYIDFEAKVSLSDTSFPLSNIKKHQTNHIRNVIKHHGISFLIIKINNHYYYLDGHDYLDFIDHNDRSSIPIDYIKAHGYEIELSYNPNLDYLKIVDKIYRIKDGLDEEKK